MNSDLQLIEDIFHHACLIMTVHETIDEETFFGDEFIQNGFIRSLEVIGEATKKISPEFRALHPEIPWRGMAGLRDRLIHGYGFVDTKQVWNIITNMVPQLYDQLLLLKNNRRGI